MFFCSFFKGIVDHTNGEQGLTQQDIEQINDAGRLKQEVQVEQPFAGLINPMNTILAGYCFGCPFWRFREN